MITDQTVGGSSPSSPAMAKKTIELKEEVTLNTFDTCVEFITLADVEEDGCYPHFSIEAYQRTNTTMVSRLNFNNTGSHDLRLMAEALNKLADRTQEVENAVNMLAAT